MLCNEPCPEGISWDRSGILVGTDIGRQAEVVGAQVAALVGGRGEGIVGVTAGEAVGQQGQRLGGSAVVLQRTQPRVNHRIAIATLTQEVTGQVLAVVSYRT